MAAPYQTYPPGGAPSPTAPLMPVVVYGATTTQADMVPESADPGTPPQTPFIPAATPTPNANVVAICYSRLLNKPDTVRDAATQACGTGSTPRITSQGVDIEACPLLTPTKAVYACAASAAH
jgi:hypothetical protein